MLSLRHALAVKVPAVKSASKRFHQIMSLLPGPLAFSHDRLRNVWEEFQPIRGRVCRNQYEILCYDSNHNLQYPRAARQFCLELYSSVQDPKNHLTKLVRSFDIINSRPLMQTTLSKSTVSLPLLIYIFQCIQIVSFRCLLS